MPAAAEPPECVDCHVPLGFAEGNNRSGQFFQEALDLALGWRASPARKNEARLHERRRTDTHVIGLEDSVHEAEVPRLGEEHRDEG